VANEKSKTLLIAFDGLSVGDAGNLLRLLPRFSKICSSSEVLPLDSSPFTAAQPIWAEILTGQSWEENGCCGYARPTRSLNTLQPTSEKDLLVPCTLLGPADNSVVINVPILRPNKLGRVWLSDGSLPLNRFVSPDSLVDDQPFANYKPRPHSDAAAQSESLTKSIESAVAIESNRLQCAIRLFHDHQWSKMVFRLTLFDLLAHLLGIDFLEGQDLKCWRVLSEFLELLDEALNSFCSQPGLRWAAISAFSHAPCRGTLCLNSFLHKNGLVNLSTGKSGSGTRTARVQATTALLGIDPPDRTLSTFEGRLAPHKTVAASPVSGCVFVNRQDIFEDGIITMSEFQQVTENIEACLRNGLGERFGFTVQVKGRTHAAPSKVPIPEFIVNIPGVEFNDIELGLRECDKPRTTHCSNGFLLLPANGESVKDALKAVQIKDLLDGRN